MMLAHADETHQHRSGFEAAVLPLTPVLYRRALRLCRDPHHAEDLVQDTVLRAWRFWPSFRPGTNCAAWLRTILGRSFITRCRRQGRERRALEAARTEEIVEETLRRPPDPADEGFGDEVLSALRTLPAEFREILSLVDIDGLSYREAAACLECPVGTVMSRLHRARRRMQEELSAA